MEERSGIDGLGEIAIHAEPEAAFLVLEDRENDDRDIHCGGIVLQHGRDIESIHLRHHDVENDEARSLLADERKGLAPIFGETNARSRLR